MLTVYMVSLSGIVFAMASPGANMLAVLNTALTQGRYAALCVAAGVATGALLWALLFALGISTLFNSYPFLVVILQFFAGGYFSYIAYKILTTPSIGEPSVGKGAVVNRTKLTAFRHGLLVILANPKAPLVWIGISTFMLSSGVTTFGLILFAPIVAACSFTVYGTYAYLFSTSTAMSFYAKTGRVFEVLFGLAFGVIGVTQLYCGVNDLFLSPVL